MHISYQLLAAQTPGMALMPHILLRLVLAACLGGMIGLEREMKQKPAGLRTQMFICVGSAFFTILSNELAGSWGGDHTRIAAQIIPGIGFIGAGSILHSRGSITGLTTAATLFVVASIGMATGGGLYLVAVFATVLGLLSLLLLGWMEQRLRLKPVTVAYEIVGADLEETLRTVNETLADQQQTMESIHVSRTDHAARVQFWVGASRRQHEALLQQLRQSPVFQRVQSLGAAEPE